MDKKQLAKLKIGQHVMYFGETDVFLGIERGETFVVIETGNLGFRMRRLSSNTRETYTVNTLNKSNSRSINSYVPITANDETDLEPNDYKDLMDLVLFLRDFKWAQELHATGIDFAI